MIRLFLDYLQYATEITAAEFHIAGRGPIASPNVRQTC